MIFNQASSSLLGANRCETCSKLCTKLVTWWISRFSESREIHLTHSYNNSEKIFKIFIGGKKWIDFFHFYIFISSETSSFLTCWDINLISGFQLQYWSWQYHKFLWKNEFLIRYLLCSKSWFSKLWVYVLYRADSLVPETCKIEKFCTSTIF